MLGDTLARYGRIFGGSALNPYVGARLLNMAVRSGMMVDAADESFWSRMVDLAAADNFAEMPSVDDWRQWKEGGGTVEALFADEAVDELPPNEEPESPSPTPEQVEHGQEIMRHVEQNVHRLDTDPDNDVPQDVKESVTTFQNMDVTASMSVDAMKNVLKAYKEARDTYREKITAMIGDASREFNTKSFALFGEGALLNAALTQKLYAFDPALAQEGKEEDDINDVLSRWSTKYKKQKMSVESTPYNAYSWFQYLAAVHINDFYPDVTSPATRGETLRKGLRRAKMADLFGSGHGLSPPFAGFASVGDHGH
jgi:hypothetical protein